MPPLMQVLRWLVLNLLLAIFLAMAIAWGRAIRRLRSGLPLLPRVRPRAVPWGARTVLLVVVIFVAVAQLVSANYSVLSGKAPDEKYSEFELLALMSAINALLLILIPLIVRLTSRARPEHLGIERQGWRQAAAVGGIGFLLLTPVVYAINAAMTLLWRAL